MTEAQKHWIDNATYNQLLGRWRSAPSGDLMFQGETGDYYAKKMKEKRAEIGDAAHVKASKEIG